MTQSDDSNEKMTQYERFIALAYKRQQMKREERSSMKHSPMWYRNCKALAGYRRQLSAAYAFAADINVDELLNATSGVQYQYQLLMESWRHAQSVLDASDLHASEERQNQALDVLKGILFSNHDRLVCRPPRPRTGDRLRR